MKRIIQVLKLTSFVLLGCFFAVKSVEAIPDKESLKTVGYCYTSRKEVKDLQGLMERKKYLEVALQKCPNDPLLTYSYAYNFDRMGKNEQALKYYQLTLKNDATYANAYLGMGEIYKERGQLKQAIEVWEQGLLMEPENKWLLQRLEQSKAGLEKENSVVSPQSLIAAQVPEKEVPAEAAEAAEVQPVQDQTPETQQHEQSEIPDIQEVIPAVQTIELASAQIISSQDEDEKGEKIEKEAQEEQEGIQESLEVLLDNDSDQQDITQDNDSQMAECKQPITTAQSIITTKNLSIIAGFSSDMIAMVQYKTGKAGIDNDVRSFFKQIICSEMNADDVSVQFEIIGHSDDLGTIKANKRIAKKRAGALSDFIAQQCSIAPERLHVLSYSKLQPMVPNISPENRELNRRVEIKRIQ